MPTIVVLGSNSFSGSDFIDLVLSETDHDVVGVSRSPEKSSLFLPYLANPGRSRVRFHALDLNHDLPALVALLEATRPEYVVNFAAQSEVAPSWEHPEQWMATNGVAVAALGHHLAGRPWLRRYLHVSSPEVYGTCEGVVKEDAPLRPSTPYAASKAAGDMVLGTLAAHRGLRLVTIRATNVYGAHQQLFKILPRTAIYLKQGRTVELHGGGAAVKSFIHVRDVSRGELAALLHGRDGELYHLSPDRGIAVRDAVATVCREAGRDFAAVTRPVAERLGQDKAYVIDSSKARGELGWAPRIAFEEGIRGVVRWVDAEWDRIAREPLEYVHKA